MVAPLCIVSRPIAMFITMSSMSISLVDRITSFIIKKEIHYMRRVSFYYIQMENDSASVAQSYRIGLWLKTPAKKWLTVVELRRGGSLRISPAKNHFESIRHHVRVNRQSLISRFHNENDFSTVMNQTRRVPTVLRFFTG